MQKNHKNEHTLQFPSFSQFFSEEKRLSKRFREWCRYQFRTQLYKKQWQALLQFLNQSPLWQPLFSQNPYRFNTLLSTYCDKRWSVKQRLSAIIGNLQQAEQLWGVERCQALLDKQSVKIASLDEALGLFLNINQIDPFEGFFSINIRNAEQSLYDASFTFLPSGELLIASIQGPKGEKAQSIVRDLTKQLHGMRPMFMLVNVFKWIASQLNVSLIGIPHQYQGKYRFNDRARLLFNYDQFWQENAGICQSLYWQIPREIECKPLDEIASKKRSMYRKRYGMFDQVAQEIALFFTK
ncbi:hypothetical protein A4G19_01625 [Pasteurellaceae bacterium Macca]|nr:hypothetical protein [Pasteurellaceae bacterium Macca]